MNEKELPEEIEDILSNLITDLKISIHFYLIENTSKIIVIEKIINRLITTINKATDKNELENRIKE